MTRLKVGRRVKVVKDAFTNGKYVGKVGRIIKFDGEPALPWHVLIDGKTICFDEDKIEVVDEEGDHGDN
jgi:hypothetical protein